MRYLVVCATVLLGCSGEPGQDIEIVFVSNGGNTDGEGGASSVVKGDPLGLGGHPSSGGADSGGADSGGADSGGADSGGADSGGADSGGTGSGGADSGGTGSGGADSGGADSGGTGSGGAAPKLLWEGSYEGQIPSRFDTKFVLAALWLDYPDCRIWLGVPFVPGDSGVFRPESTYDLSCANPDKAPVGMFGDSEQALPMLPAALTGDHTVSFTLYEFASTEWPPVLNTDATVDYRWEIFAE